MTKKLTEVVKGNGGNIAKIVLGLAVAGAGLFSAVASRRNDDGSEYVLSDEEINGLTGEESEESTDDSSEEAGE